MSDRARRTARPAASLALAVLIAGLAAGGARAQVVSQGGLDQPDPWGLGWIGQAEGALDRGLWGNSDPAVLDAAFTAVDVRNLSPAGLALVRRVVLSGALAPAGAGDLIARRVALLEAAGEHERAVDLRSRFPDAAWAAGAEARRSEIQLALGQSSAACQRVGDVDPSDPVWMHARALCFAVAGNLPAAGLVAEMSQTATGGADAWLIAALDALREPSKSKPPADFSGPFEAAASVIAQLPPAADAWKSTPVGVAVMVLRHPQSTPAQKQAVLPAAAAHGRVSSDEARAVLALPREEPPAAARSPLDPDALLRSALAAAANADLAPAARATAYAAALKSADGPAVFRLAAIALAPDIARLPRDADTLPLAETFVRAGLAAGDPGAAAAWRAAMDAAEKKDEWALARLDLMLALATGGDAGGGGVLDRLIAAAPPAPAAGARAGSEPPQNALRRIETTRALFLAAGLGLRLSAPARQRLEGSRPAGRGVPDAALTRIEAARAAGAPGEALLASAAQLQPDPSAMSFAGLGDLLASIGALGLGEQADALMLEALQPWKAI